MASRDRIERVVVFPVSREEVWEALTEPEQLSVWLGAQVELDLKPGGSALFCEDDGDPMRAVVEEVDPPRRFAFRWRFPDNDPKQPSSTPRGTLVEFTLDEVPEGTQLTLVESGFSSVPQTLHVIPQPGWDKEIQGLVAYFGAYVGV